MQTEIKSERVVKSLRASLLIDELDAHIVTAQHFARVTQEELEQLDLRTTDPKQKLLISPFGSIRWSRHLMALLYARQQAMLFMMDACARQLGEDSPFNDDPLFIERAGTSNYEHYERALMFAMGARVAGASPARRGAGASPASRRRSADGRSWGGTPHDYAGKVPASRAAGTATSLYGAASRQAGTRVPALRDGDGSAVKGRPSAGSTAGACGTHAPGAGETSALRVAPAVMPGHEAVQCSTEPMVAQSATGSTGTYVDEAWILDCADESPMPPHDCGGYEGALDRRLECALPLGVRRHEGPGLASGPDVVLQQQGPGGGLVTPGS